MTAPASPTATQLRDSSLLKSQAYVDGSWTGEPRDPVINPASGEEISRVPRLGATEAEAAVTAASLAFRGWSAQLANHRSSLLRGWFELILAHREDLAKILTMEQGKPISEARVEI